MTDANGDTVEFEYDHLNRRTRIVYDDDSADESVWDALGRLVATVDQNGRRTDFTYDCAGRLTEAGGRHVAYAYDAVYRQSSETITDPVHGDKTLAYTFDRVGNRLTSTEDSVTTSSTYDANDRLLTAGDVSFDYDANGNLTRRTHPEGADTYEYDREDRLIRAQAGGRTVDLAYDDDGLRIRRTVDGTERTDFLYDANRPLARVLTELDAAGNPSAEYVHGNGVLSMARGGDVHTFHADAQGTTRARSRKTSSRQLFRLTPLTNWIDSPAPRGGGFPSRRMLQHTPAVRHRAAATTNGVRR